jgi:kynurenine formamidase
VVATGQEELTQRRELTQLVRDSFRQRRMLNLCISPTTRAAARAPAVACALPLVAWSAALVSCTPAGGEVARLFADSTAWIDLTYGFGDRTVYWPTVQGFRLERVAEGMTPGGYYYAANNLSGAEHGGTHLDAPIHFAEGRWTADQIPVHRLVGSAVVVDVADRAAANPDYLVTVADLESLPAGVSLEGAIVLIRTGWGRYWTDPVRYLGTSLQGAEAASQLHFPGLAPDAARWLAERRVDAVGIDTPSIDHGPSTAFESHRILFDANVPAFENVANLERLPVTGAFIVALPMKIEGGSGGPLRIVGIVP